jgi:hypothetical protein
MDKYIVKKEGDQYSIFLVNEKKEELRIAVIPRWYQNDRGIANGIVAALTNSKIKLDVTI